MISQGKHALMNKNTDFQKKKRKLGKAKPKNATHTSTAFKTKALQMAAQSVLEEKGELVNFRNLTLKDLLTQLKHYNESVRREALSGLRDLFSKHPQLLLLHLSSVLEGLLELITDTDRPTRLALISLFEMLIPMFDEATLGAYHPLIQVYVQSGLTHMTGGVRRTSLKLANMFMDRFPTLLLPVIDRVLPSFVTMLNKSANPATAQAQASTATKNSTKGALKITPLEFKIELYSTILKMIKSACVSSSIALSSTTKENPAPKTPAHLWTNSGKNALSLNMDSARHTSRQVPLVVLSHATTHTSAKSPVEFIRDFAPSVIPSLVSNWVECVGDTNEETHLSNQNLELMQIVLDLLNVILDLDHKSRSSGGDTVSGVDIFGDGSLKKDAMRYFSVRFPFTNTQQSDSKEFDMTLAINIGLCNFLVHFLPQKRGDIAVGSRGSAKLESWSTPIVEYIMNSFQAQGKVNSIQYKGQIGLLEPLKRVLHLATPDTANLLLKAFMEFNNNSHPQSASKRACAEFISEILLAYEMGEGSKTHHRFLPSASSESVVKDCLMSLPKLLYNVQAQNIPTSEMILSTFLWLAKSKPQLFAEIQLPLVPFFFTTVKPSQKYPNGVRVFGPFLDLPANLQLSSINLLYYFKKIEPALEKAILVCCLHTKHDSNEIIMDVRVFSQVLDILRQRFEAGDLALERHLGILMTLFAGLVRIKPTPAEEDLARWTAKINEMIGCVCWSVSNLCGKYKATDLYRVFSGVIETTLVDYQLSLLGVTCAVKLTEACLRDTTTWALVSDTPEPPQSLMKLLPNVLVTCFLAYTAAHNASFDLSAFVWVLANLSLLPPIFKIFSEIVITKKDLLYDVVGCVHTITTTHSLESTLRHTHCKESLLDLVKCFTTIDDMSSEISPKTAILRKLLSEVELLYGSAAI